MDRFDRFLASVNLEEIANEVGKAFRFEIVQTGAGQQDISALVSYAYKQAVIDATKASGKMMFSYLRAYDEFLRREGLE